jgi:hypothetical protein
MVFLTLINVEVFGLFGTLRYHHQGACNFAEQNLHLNLTDRILPFICAAEREQINPGPLPSAYILRQKRLRYW